MMPFDPNAMAWCKDHFYFFIGDVLLRITPDGQIEFASIGATIRQMAVSGPLTAQKIALLTIEGYPCHTLTQRNESKHRLICPGTEAHHEQLMTDKRLVIAGDKRAAVYDLSHDTPV